MIYKNSPDKEALPGEVLKEDTPKIEWFESDPNYRVHSLAYDVFNEVEERYVAVYKIKSAVKVYAPNLCIPKGIYATSQNLWLCAINLYELGSMTGYFPFEKQAYLNLEENNRKTLNFSVLDDSYLLKDSDIQPIVDVQGFYEKHNPEGDLPLITSWNLENSGKQWRYYTLLENLISLNND